MDKAFINQMSQKWDQHDPKAKDSILQILHKYGSIDSKDFHQGLMVGLLLPFEQLKGVGKILNEIDESQRLFYFSLLMLRLNWMKNNLILR